MKKSIAANCANDANDGIGKKAAKREKTEALFALLVRRGGFAAVFYDVLDNFFAED